MACEAGDLVGGPSLLLTGCLTKSVVLKRGDFVCRGQLAMSGGISGCHEWGPAPGL